MAEKKEQSGNEDLNILHQELTELTRELQKCNKYMDIYFTANGIYDKAAEAILIRRLTDAETKKDRIWQNTSM